jgi:hypothetical protein
MPATFAPITDRPRLFDDGPTARPRRPAPRGRDRAAVDTERTQRIPDHARDAPELTPGDPAPAAREPAPAAREPAPAAHEPAPRDPELAPRDPELAPRGDRPTGADASGPAPTLDYVILGIWDDLTAHRTVSCPVCHGHMAPRYGSGAHPVGGRCRRCGSSLG